jgi:PHD/YefM family antitoxin component YafN of YafNO toxin-antitoxin module
LIPNPIRKVLSSIQRNHVRALLMGGQACVLYGAAEFSRDTDLAILASPANFERLRRALADLQAEVIAVPPFEPRFLLKGHAIHFSLSSP